MNKPALIAFVIASIVGGAVVTFNACTSSSTHPETMAPAADETNSALHLDNMDTHSLALPTAESLFLKSKYMLKIADVKDASDLSDEHGGQDLDLQTHRPLYDLGQTLFAQKYAKPGYTLAANFFHEGAFYIARIPTDGVRGVFFTMALVPPKSGSKFFAGETRLRLQMDPNHLVELVAEMPTEEVLKKLQDLPPSAALARLPNENPASDPRVENFTIGSEAVLTKGEGVEPFSWSVALHGGYTQALTFRSMEESLVTLYKTGEPINEYKLHVTPEEGSRIVSEALRQSQADGLTTRYTFAANCTAKPYAILQAALSVSDARFAYLQKMMSLRTPTLAPKVLAENGLEGEIPLQLDRSLGQDSNVAFERVFGGRSLDICKASRAYRGYHCDTIRGAVAALEAWGRLPASTSKADITTDAEREPAMSAADEKAAAADDRAQKELGQSARKKGLGASSGYESEDVLH